MKVLHLLCLWNAAYESCESLLAALFTFHPVNLLVYLWFLGKEVFENQTEQFDVQMEQKFGFTCVRGY